MQDIEDDNWKPGDPDPLVTEYEVRDLYQRYGFRHHYPFGPMVTTSLMPKASVAVINEWADKAFAGELEAHDMSKNLVGKQKQELLLPEQVAKDSGLWSWLQASANMYFQTWAASTAEMNAGFGPSAPTLKGVSIDSIWVNQAFAGDYNFMHTHTGTVSGILYLKFPQEIKKEQIEGKQGVDNLPKNFYNGATQIIGPNLMAHFLNNNRMDITDPVQGLFVMFPSWCYHSVMPFYSPDVERRTLSYNLTFDFEEHKGTNPKDAMQTNNQG